MERRTKGQAKSNMGIGQKNIEWFLRPFLLKADAAGWLLKFFIQQKTDAGTIDF